MNYYFRKATANDIPEIWQIIQQAILRRKKDGSDQWQDGYPNLTIIENDNKKSAGYVLTLDESIIGYCAIFINDEPEYDKIVGKWLTSGDFVVFHRLAIAEGQLRKGLAYMILVYIEEFSLRNKIHSIKADTNFDNFAMLKIFEKMNYIYCGEVTFRGSVRKAFEKVISKY
jgi:hypothetical protein